MSESKFSIPTEIIDLPSKGLIYPKENILSSGSVEMKYMTAKEEDILTNVNLLRQGIAVEKVLKSLVVSKINHDDLTLGDRNALLIAARILAYGKDYTFKFPHPITREDEIVTVDLQNLKYKELDFSKFENKNEFSFKLPYTSNTITYKILTVADDRKIEEEKKGLKKNLGTEAGEITTRLKHQITSVNGDYSTKTVRDFIDSGALLAKDALALRQEIAKNSPDVDMSVLIIFKDGEELRVDLPMGVEFFFPGSGV